MRLKQQGLNDSPTVAGSVLKSKRPVGPSIANSRCNNARSKMRFRVEGSG